MTDRPEPKTELDRLAQSPQPGIAAELLAFLRDNKKWWLLPILLMIGGLGALVALASTGLAPFIYTMF